MYFEIVELGYFIDQINGVKLGMRGYVTGIRSKYGDHVLYEVDIVEYGYYLLWDWQIKEVM
jgi:hypothetical protein